MIAAVIAAAALGLAVVALVAWLTHGRIAAGDALVAAQRDAQAKVTALADERDDYHRRWQQAAADLAAEQASHAQDRATLVRTARELNAAMQELTDAHRSEIHGASDADLAAAVGQLLQARIAAEDARDRDRAARAAGDGDAPGRAADVPGPGAAAEAGPAGDGGAG